MSLVPSFGPKRALYNAARAPGASESTCSQFWQYLVQKYFYEEEYIVASEVAPDKTQRRVDLAVRVWNESQDTISTILFLEAKHSTGNAKEVEKQAHDASKRAIEHDNLIGIWSVTTIGTRFRVWYTSADDKVLSPLHGSLEVCHTVREYAEVDSDGAQHLRQAFDTVKAKPPLRRAPVVPSQSLDTVHVPQYTEESVEQNWPYLYGNAGGAMGSDSAMQQASEDAQDAWPTQHAA